MQYKFTLNCYSNPLCPPGLNWKLDDSSLEYVLSETRIVPKRFYGFMVSLHAPAVRNPRRL